MSKRLVLCLVLLVGLVGCSSEEPTNPTAVPRVQSKPKNHKPPPPDDGPREIVFVSEVRKKGWCLRSMTADGGSVSTVFCPDDNVGAWQPSWEPSGAAIAYRTVMASEIFRVDVGADGSAANNTRLLTAADCGGWCNLPKWSPLGDEIAVLFAGDTGQPPKILIIPASGCPFPGGGPCPQVLYTESEDADTFFNGLAWSPDGTQLAVTVQRGPGGSSVPFVVVVNRSDGTRASEYQFHGDTIDWGRGSRANKLVVTSGGLHLFDVTTGLSEFLVADGRGGTFSPDGDAIVYQRTTRNGRLMRLDLASGVTVELAGGMMAEWKKPGSL